MRGCRPRRIDRRLMFKRDAALERGSFISR
jgi:hypothetical protein